MDIEAPSELVDSWRSGNVALFVGSGASVGSGLPTWSELIGTLAQELPDRPATADHTTLASYYELAFGRHRLISTLSAALRIGAPNALHRSIAALRPRSLFTTNFDDLLEQALRDERYPYSVVIADDEIPFISSSICPVVKLHGSIDRPSSIVFTNRDYELYEHRHPGIARLLAAELQTKTVLLVGYSASDPDFRMILSRIQEEARPHSRRLFMLSFSPTRLERLELASRSIGVIDLGPLADGDATARASAWIDDLRLQVREMPDRSRKQPKQELISGKHERTALLVQAAREFTEKPAVRHEIIRLRQGYSALSLGDNDHDDDLHYNEFLVQERNAFLALLERGVEMRLIIGRRPIFSSDLTSGSSSDVALALRLRGRCSRLIALLQSAVSQENPPRLVAVCSEASHLADVALGADILFRGVRSDSASGYSVTVVSRTLETVEGFCDSFDQEFEGLAKTHLPLKWNRNLVRRLNELAIADLSKSLTTLDDWLASQDV
jgi:SIR2-like domain